MRLISFSLLLYLLYTTTYCTIIRTVDLSSTCTRHYRFKDVNAQKFGRRLLVELVELVLVIKTFNDTLF